MRKDNTILYKGNRYSVPLGTYRPEKKVRLCMQEEMLRIVDSQTASLLAEHHLAQGRGLLIKSRSHRRDNTMVIDELQEKALECLGKTATAQKLIATIRKEKSRYARGQFQLLRKIAGKYSADIVQQSIAECLRLNLISAVACRDVASFLYQQQQLPSPKKQAVQTIPSVNGITPIIQTEHRHLQAYTQLYGATAK